MRQSVPIGSVCCPLTVQQLLSHLLSARPEKSGSLTNETQLIIDSDEIGADLKNRGVGPAELAELLDPYVGEDPDDFSADLDESTQPENMEWRVNRKERKKGRGKNVRIWTQYIFKLRNAPGGAYNRIIEKIFTDRYREGDTEVHFARTDFEKTARALSASLPKNLGDIIYSYRYRRRLPRLVRSKQTEGREWIIRGTGDGQYKFRLSKINRITYDPDQRVIPILESTPQLIARYAKKNDEQELLAKIRYNRLIDIFLGITSFSLQSHLRTKVAGIGQIEIDEFYVGMDSDGVHYVIPVQAKTGSDKLAVIQTEQDIIYCQQKFPGAACRAVSAQFLSPTKIAMFELVYENETVEKSRERIYELISTIDFDK